MLLIPIDAAPEDERQRQPIVTVTLVAINIAVFVAAHSFGWSAREYGLQPAGLWAGELDQLRNLLLAAFLHFGLLHIAGNMLFLWVFGANVEDEMGHLGFAVFYLVCGLGAGIIESALFANDTIPRIGASGAIAGVLGAYLVLFPLSPIGILPIHILGIWMLGRLTGHAEDRPPTFDVSALIVIGVWLVLQIIGSVGSAVGQEGGIAYTAHLGGFAVGFAIVQVLRRGFGFAPDADDSEPAIVRQSGSQLLVARRPLPAGHTLKPEDIEPYTWRHSFPDGYFKPEEAASLYGRRLLRNRYRYHAILEDDLESMDPVPS